MILVSVFVICLVYFETLKAYMRMMHVYIYIHHISYVDIILNVYTIVYSHHYSPTLLFPLMPNIRVLGPVISVFEQERNSQCSVPADNQAVKMHPRSLTARHRKMIVGRQALPFGI